MGGPKKVWRGFTLVELLVVMAIVALLASMALPRYFRGLERSRDAVLIENLRVTREMIEKFHEDSGSYPASLQELVKRRYLKALPYDPITESHTSWRIIAPPGNDKGHVYDITSGARGHTREGRPYQGL